jgi:hypothetical protein
MASSRRRSVDLDDLEFFPTDMTHGDILHRLATFSRDDVEALRVLAEDRLRRWWALTYHQSAQPH